MRDPQRITRILAKIACIWSEVPDARLLQLLSNIQHIAGDTTQAFYLEDDDLEHMLDVHIRLQEVYGDILSSPSKSEQPISVVGEETLEGGDDTGGRT